MIKKYGIITASIILLGILGLGYLTGQKLSKQPGNKATKPSTTSISSPPIIPMKKNTVIWGKITDEKGTPLSDLLITFNDEGTTTDKEGNYSIGLKKPIQQVSVRFYNSETREQYQRADTFEQTLYLSNKLNTHQDFVLKKVTQ